MAMSTMIRIANAGSCSIVRSTPRAIIPRSSPLGVRARVVAVDLDERSALRHEVADGVSEHEPTPVRVRVADEAPTVDRLDRAGACAPDDAGGLLRRLEVGRQDVRRLARGRGRHALLERPPARSRDEGGDRHGPQAVEEPVEEEQEQDQAHEHEAAREP